MRLSNLVIWILFFASIGTIVWYIFGNSPNLEQAVLVLVLTVLFTMAVKVGDFGARMKIFEKRFYRLEKSFVRLADDFKSERIRRRK